MARISPGAGAQAGICVRHDYQTTLLMQRAFDAGRFDAEVEPSPVVRGQVHDLVYGAPVGYCTTRAISAQDEPPRRRSKSIVASGPAAGRTKNGRYAPRPEVG